MSGSSSSSAVMVPPTKYDVFLSFRGQDTRKNFISHLYAALERKNIKAFIDDRSLETGDEISPELNKAIEDSMIYVVVFSKDYASSSWCLNELVKILECKKKYDHQRHVMPIFYHVEPATVRHQKETYADAFEKHQNRLVPEEVIQRWKDALTEVAGISGWDSNAARTESEFVNDIAEDILKKLDRSISCDSDNKGMVRIDKHIAQIKSLLQLESEAVRIIGIWGMGGIGKTTLSQALHNNLRTQFSSRSCVLNAQQEIDRVGIDSLRKKYLSELLEEDITSSGLHFAIERVKCAKVLLILDDLKISCQLQQLIGGHGNFGHGSRIIVTSRDLQVLKNAEADRIYQVKEMSYKDSLKLFRLRAFKSNTPVGGYQDLVEEVLKYAKGVPLALQVLGSLLYDKKREVWESLLQKLRKLPNRQITDVLKLSYDGLDDEEKDIFLDIACFYIGWFEDLAVDFIDACGFSAEVGMEVLKDRGLISILQDRVVVHDLIREMGKDIVHQQCANDPGKRSRLWDREEIFNVLKKNKGTDAIQCIFLDMCTKTVVQLHPEIFKSIPNLRMLYFHKEYLAGQIHWDGFSAFLESLPDSLKVLHWDGFPHRSLPICPENLVELHMPHSKLEQLWEDDQELSNLKRLDLGGCKKLVRIPDLSKFPNIEDILLSGCEGLIEVYSSSFLNKLKCLWLNDCLELTGLNVPSNILLRSSGSVGLNNCRKLKTFSISRTSTEVVESRGRSHFDGLSGAKAIYNGERGYIKKSIYPELCLRVFGPSRSSHELCLLDLGNCELLTSLPINLCELKLLKRLCLRGCSNLKTFPEIEDTMENLAELILDGTAIQELPSSLDRLVGLQELSLFDCRRLEIIPSSIGRLTRLHKLKLCFCESLETFPSSIFKLKLTELDLIGCSKIKTFPEILEPAESFTRMNLSHTAIKELPSSLDLLVGLQELSLSNCPRLEIIPCSIGRLTRLRKLDLRFCESLETFPSSIFKLKLTTLDLIGCPMLKTFPEILEPGESFTHIILRSTAVKELPSSLDFLVGLQELSLSNCPRLEIIPCSIGRLTRLCKFNITFCESLETFPSSIFKLKLTKLKLHGCSMLKTFPEILEPAESFTEIDISYTAVKELPSSLDFLVGLQTLRLKGCRYLESLPNSICNLKLLSLLDCSECAILTEIPNDICCLEYLDVSYTEIVNLPDSIAHLSSLKSLNVSGCRKLECIPQFPQFLKKLLAFDCTSITRVMPNSTLKHPSDSKKGTFEFLFTSDEDQDPIARSDVVADARLRISEDAYRFVYYLFPGSAVPDWFPYRCEGDSVTVDEDSLNWCNDNRLIGFAMCFILQHKDTKYGWFECSITVKSDGHTFTLPLDSDLGYSFFCSASQMCRRDWPRDQTFLWKSYLSDSVNKGIFHASSFTFEITDAGPYKSRYEVKECGICPLYTKEK